MTQAWVHREKDPDPDGKQLAATQEPLAEATKLVQQLKQYAGDRIKTHLLAFEVSFQGLSHAPHQTCKAMSTSVHFQFIGHSCMSAHYTGMTGPGYCMHSLDGRSLWIPQQCHLRFQVQPDHKSGAQAQPPTVPLLLAFEHCSPCMLTQLCLLLACQHSLRVHIIQYVLAVSSDMCMQ